MSLTSWLRKGTPLKRPRTEGLPDPRDQTSEATAHLFQAANDQIDHHAEQQPTKRRRKEYKSYDDQTRLDIAKSAIAIGPAKTARKFAINESTVRSIKTRYLRLKETWTGTHQLTKLSPR